MKSRNLNIEAEGDLVYIQFPKLAECKAVKHIFSTRKGGVSTGECASMNLSFNRNDTRENVLENYRRLCGAVGIDPEALVLSHQTHTSNVRSVTEADRGTGVTLPPFCDVDGLVTDRHGVALVTQYADCTPLLFCDPVKRVAASSHAGWRGTAKEIGRVTVEKMASEYGCRPSDIIVGIGPCIGACCYEVDGPVYAEFSRISYLKTDKIFHTKSNNRYMLDLVEANFQILTNAGVLPENIDRSDICTCCNSDLLHSHRATGGKRGNLAAIIQLS